jgi:hypothetical protein
MSKKLWSDHKNMKSLMEGWRGFVSEEEISGADPVQGVVPVVNFLNSEQGKDPKVRAALEAGRFDGDPNDEVIDISEPTPAVKSLGPTQNQISLMKSIGWPLSTQDSVKNVSTGDITGRGKRIVTSDNLVIDGHHRWSSTWATAGADAKINATNIGLPGGDPDQKLAVAQISIAATMPNDSGNVPKATAGGDDNILGKGAKEIKQMILDRAGSQTEGGILLGPEYLAQIVQNPAAQDLWNLKPEMTPDQATEAIISVVATNLSQLPAPQGPTRDYMPQFDGGETHKGEVSLNQVIDKMKSGQVNYDDPSMDDLRRKRKAAGIKKTKDHFQPSKQVKGGRSRMEEMIRKEIKRIVKRKK